MPITESLLWGVLVGAVIGAGLASYVARDLDAFEWEHPSTPLGLMVADLLYAPVLMFLLGWPAGWLVGLPKPWLVALLAAGIDLVLGWLWHFLDEDDGLLRVWPLGTVVKHACAYALPAAAIGADTDLPAGSVDLVWLLGVPLALLVVSRIVQRVLWTRSELRGIRELDVPIVVPVVAGRPLRAVGPAEDGRRLALYFQGRDLHAVTVLLQRWSGPFPTARGWQPPNMRGPMSHTPEPDGDGRWIVRGWPETHVLTVRDGTLVAVAANATFVDVDDLRDAASGPMRPATDRELLRRLARRERPWW